MFSATTAPALTGSPLDRSDHLRADKDLIKKLSLRANAQIVPVLKGDILMAEGQLVHVSGTDPLVQGGEMIFLGMRGEEPWFAAAVQPIEPPEGMEIVELRDAILHGTLEGESVAIAGTAKALVNWHHLHPRCARCGGKTFLSNAGWRRDCSECDAQQFPRTDPVVIMLIVNQDRCAIARNVNFPPELYSCIAGFMEPGESVEEAVRRETLEELGLKAGRVSYVSSQPWPFPASLMLGCIAETDDTEFTLEAAEISDAKWLTRGELSQLFAGNIDGMSTPRNGAIARTLLLDWLEGRIGF